MHINRPQPRLPSPAFAFSTTPRRSVRPGYSTRKQHLRNLNDILYYSIQRGDLIRARKAWSVLVRCPEVNWKELSRVGLLLVGGERAPVSVIDDLEMGDIFGTSNQGRIDYLKLMMLRDADNRVSILLDLILELIQQEKYQAALDELELYLPSFPFQENALLHTYAGLLSLYIAQPLSSATELGLATVDPLKDASASQTSLKSAKVTESLTRHANSYFERAKHLDPEGGYAFILHNQLSSVNVDSDIEGLSDIYTNSPYQGEDNGRERKRIHLSKPGS